jgi:predicted O-methyltransferase YrrM
MKLPWVPRRPGPMSGPPISSSLTDREASVLRSLARGYKVIEVGSAYGYSTVVMGAVARLVVSVDHHRHLNSLEALKWNLEAYHLTDRVFVLVGESRDILPTLPDESFDGAFMDGDHSWSVLEGGWRSTTGTRTPARRCVLRFRNSSVTGWGRGN